MADIDFLRDANADGVNLADDPKIALLAECIISQQEAGFKRNGKPLADLREANCYECAASGYNTGWGYFKFLCGMENCNGEEHAPCGNPKEATP